MQVQLITCVHRLCGDLKGLRSVLQGPLRGLFGGLATVFAAMLFGGLLLNRIFDPARNRLQQLDRSEYEVGRSRCATIKLVQVYGLSYGTSHQWLHAYSAENS